MGQRLANWDLDASSGTWGHGFASGNPNTLSSAASTRARNDQYGRTRLCLDASRGDLRRRESCAGHRFYNCHCNLAWTRPTPSFHFRQLKVPPFGSCCKIQSRARTRKKEMKLYRFNLRLRSWFLGGPVDLLEQPWHVSDSLPFRSISWNVSAQATEDGVVWTQEWRNEGVLSILHTSSSK